jgi:hypothetical protein
VLTGLLTPFSSAQSLVWPSQSLLKLRIIKLSDNRGSDALRTEISRSSIEVTHPAKKDSKSAQIGITTILCRQVPLVTVYFFMLLI